MKLLSTEYIKIRNRIRKYLRAKGIYEDIDNVLIDELCFNLFLCDEAKINIKKNGILVNVVRDPDKAPLYQSNQAVNIYQQAVKNVNAIAVKLGLNPQERVKLQLQADQEKDDLDNLIG